MYLLSYASQPKNILCLCCILTKQSGQSQAKKPG